MAMQSLSKLDEEILVCSICLDTLKEPKILGCLHRYCKECLASVIENIPNLGTFKCPTCRQEHTVPDGGVDGMKGDFLLEAVLETRKLEKDLKEKQKEQVCSSCDKHTTVVAICPDCGGFVCEDCHQSHRILKVFCSHHYVVTLEDIESGEVAFNAQSVTSTSKAPKCPVHKDMILHINCRTCDKLICPVCAPIHHNTHQLEEIASASKRIKSIVYELLEKSVQSGKTLEEHMEEFRKISRVKLGEISLRYKQLKEIADREEQMLRKSEEEFLKLLEQKKEMKQEKTKEDIRNLRHGEAFLAEEINMIEKFCTQKIQEMEEEAGEKLKKMRNSQMTAQIMTENVDNWAVLLSSSDVQDNLQSTTKGNTVKQVQLAGGILAELAVELHGLRLSVIGSKCWKVEWIMELSKLDKNWVVNGHTKTNYDMKFIQEINRLTLAGRVNVSIGISVIEISSKTIAENYTFMFVGCEDPTPKFIRVAGILNRSIYVSSKCSAYQLSILSHEKENLFPSSFFKVGAENVLVTCVGQYKNEAKLIVGLSGSAVLHVCDFDANSLSSIEVKVDDLCPPVSLATTKKDNVLLCDGVSNAIAVDCEGNMISKFGGRTLTDRPIVISVDRNERVYVLWKMKEEKEEKHKDEYKEDADNEDANKEEEEEEEEEYDFAEEEEEKDAPNNNPSKKTITNVVRQYSPSGAFISEFIVGSDVTMMTTIVTEDDKDAVAVGTPDGLIQCYGMTSFGRTWSNFIQQQSNT